MSLPQLLRPIVQGLETLSKGAGANAVLLQKIDSRLDSDGPAPDRLSGVAGELRAMLEMKQGVNQNMFAALHEELKGYKDGFLLEAVQRPIIRDLITIYDDLTELRRQVGQSVNEPVPGGENTPFTVRLYERLRSLHTRLDHQIEFVLEVLARLEVSQIEPHLGRLNKQSQRAVAVEMAEDPEEDCLVVKVLRRGFQWRDRVLRAEEVVIKKWKEGYLVALQPENEEPK
jgi:molecular chaperone GrpE (heat shock protein)